MTVAAQSETRGFQTEVKQLLHLMINSLYSNKEIFLRELISNASDAIDKLRFKGLSDSALYENDSDLAVYISFNKEAKTITIRDNGVGMTRDEVITNLGTIAHSGTKEFLSKMSGDKAKDSQLIGQFGVGFYSAFIVADKVEVFTRAAGHTQENGVHWVSEASSDYIVENIEWAPRGTTIVLHLKEDASEFLDHYRLKNIITKYSDHIALPIMMEKEPELDKDGKKVEKAGEPEQEVVNQAKALWTVEKSKIKDDDYKALYKHISHDFEDPLAWAHNKVEGSMEYTNLLYIPARAPFDLWNREGQRGLKLYVQRVFIMDDAENFLPMYLRFIKGVIDTKDLPLNISREILQNDRVTDKLRGALVKRVLSLLEELAEKEPEKYAIFWKQFGAVLKEAPGEDFANKERVAKLFRFASTTTDTNAQTHSLNDYIGRMQTTQDKIYYITAESFEAAKNSPHLEIFRQKGIEVLLLSDRVDEWWLGYLNEFEGKKLQSVAKGDLDLSSLGEEPESKEEKEKEKNDFESVLKQMKEVLGDKVKEVRLSHRLTGSPSCVVADDNDMGIHMQRIMQAAGQDFGGSKPVFEINPKHILITNIKTEADDDRFAEWTKLLFEQAVLAEGGHLDNPAEFVQRMNKLLIG